MTREVVDVDVAVIGAGGGGYPGAFFLGRAGKSVMMVDPIGNLGGDCLAEGCVPSKAVREVSVARAQTRHFDSFGLVGEAPGVRWAQVLAHKDHVQQTRYDQHTAEIANSTVVFHKGTARITGANTLEVTTADDIIDYRFTDLILASGSAPAVLPIPGAELAVTSHDVFRLNADVPFPSHPVIIGGGYIGVELASMLENFGSEPVVLEATGRVLPGFDDEVADGVFRALSTRVEIRTEAFVTAVEKNGDAYDVRLTHDGVESVVSGDMVVMATGRRTVLPAGCELLGFQPHETPVVDAQLRTKTPHVYAPGDVNGLSMLFHSAVRQSLVAAHVIAAGGQSVDAMVFEAVPKTVFTEPEAASVGLTEAEAVERYGSVKVGRYDYAGDARAQIFDEAEGFIKLVFDARSTRLVGAQILGMDAAHLIAPLAQAVDAGSTAGDLSRTVYPHPMIDEGIAKAALAVNA